MLSIILGIIAIYGPIILPVFSIILLSNILDIVSDKVYVTDKQKRRIIISATFILVVFAALLSTIAFN
ncbi:hypothetical protein JOE23_001518 [Amphibacillus cookii]|nr:hypothetical protein [Amphibacillus cookii]